MRSCWCAASRAALGQAGHDVWVWGVAELARLS